MVEPGFHLGQSNELLLPIPDARPGLLVLHTQSLPARSHHVTGGSTSASRAGAGSPCRATRTPARCMEHGQPPVLPMEQAFPQQTVFHRLWKGGWLWLDVHLQQVSGFQASKPRADRQLLLFLLPTRLTNARLAQGCGYGPWSGKSCEVGESWIQGPPLPGCRGQLMSPRLTTIVHT